MLTHGQRLGLSMRLGLLLALFAAHAAAQETVGNIYGTILDPAGAEIPGATVTLTPTGPGAGTPKVEVSNALGQVRFLGLESGSYGLKVELEGWVTLGYDGVKVTAGRNTQVEVKLEPETSVEVTVGGDDPPVLSTDFSPIGVTVTEADLERIPTSRDLVAIAASIPGVLADRRPLSALAPRIAGPGVLPGQTLWSLDGIFVTPFPEGSHPDALPVVFDFGALSEIRAATGGADARVASGGLVFDLTVRRGTNEVKGSARALETSGRSRPGGGSLRGREVGAEWGGPMVRDRLWGWGSLGRSALDRTVPAGETTIADRDRIENGALRVALQFTEANAANLLALQNDMGETGAGAGPSRGPESAWRESKQGAGPTLAKLEDTHIFASNFFATALASSLRSGYRLTPLGTQEGPALLDENDLWSRSFRFDRSQRSQSQGRLDGSGFTARGELSHELWGGAERGQARTDSASAWNGDGILFDGPSHFDAEADVLAVTRPSATQAVLRRLGLYAQDTLRTQRLTLTAGLRHDRQSGRTLGRQLSGSRFAGSPSAVLPPTRVGGGDIGFTWSDLVPRLSFSYVLGPERKTLLRASASRFADALDPGLAAAADPARRIGAAYFLDRNGDGRPDGPTPFAFSGNVDPRSGALLVSDRLDPRLSAPRTDELAVSLEHTFGSGLDLGIQASERKLTHRIAARRLVFDDPDPFCPACLDSTGRPDRRSDYEAVTLPERRIGTDPSGQPIFGPLTYYRLRPGISSRNGVLLTNGKREQEARTASLTVNRRLEGGWMLRGHFTLSDWRWSRVPESERTNPTAFAGGGSRTGDAVLLGAGGDPGAAGMTTPNALGGTSDAPLNARWSYSVNALYQIAPTRRWGFDVSLNAYGHQGYPLPDSQRVLLGASEGWAALDVQVTTRPDDRRLPDLHQIDLRLAKEISIRSSWLTLSLDAFNLLNRGTVLQRNTRLEQATANQAVVFTAPRAWRLGVSVSAP